MTKGVQVMSHVMSQLPERVYANFEDEIYLRGVNVISRKILKDSRVIILGAKREFKDI